MVGRKSEMDGGERWQAVLVLCGGAEGEYSVCEHRWTCTTQALSVSVLMLYRLVAALADSDSELMSNNTTVINIH